MSPIRIIAAAFVLALIVPAARADGDPLAAGLQDKAPAVLAHLKKKGFANVGVLKFVVRHGDGPARDDAGDLNLSLANKTEVALILANTDERFGIIDKASEFVDREKMTSANHLTAAGRKAFFARKYDLAWSRDKVEPSGFVTGLVTLSDDLKRMTIRLQVFDKTGDVEDLPGEITAATDVETLAQAGFSYTLAPTRQKALIAGEPPPSAAVRRTEAVEGAVRAAAPETNPETPVDVLADCPVKWKVLYNGKPAKVRGTTVPEPGDDDRLEFELTNPGPGTYAVVLLVNGENTLYQERVAPAVCRKWVLPAGAAVTVRGFQMGPNMVVPFKVVRPEDAGPDAVSYGPHAGTFRLVAYHGMTTSTPPADDREIVGDGKAGALMAIARTRGTTRPAGVKPQSLKALQADLRGRAKGADGARGYVVKGGTAERFDTESVYFTPTTDTPVADVSLRYFGPKKN
ncbi:MAG: hypothetical protein JWO38_5907 [Gemmataceae bacterium]|nr:hypothetical protein [Gemmataceae bacterium]